MPELLGMLAFSAVLATFGAPGITVDEPLDVRPGREYLRLAAATGWRFFSPEVVERTYLDNKEHPPLGRWLLGVSSRLFEPIEVQLRGPDPVGLYIRSARVAPAVCFALLVVLVARAAHGLAGACAAGAAGLALIFMPRSFAHAHLGALDTFVALSWTAALLAVMRAVKARHPGRAMILAGVVWGLALLVKIHAWLLPPLVICYCVWRLGWRLGLLAGLGWAAAGLCVFLAGWPWLWYETLPRLSSYLLTVVRAPTMVEYFGTIYADTQVPWHYPWVYFLTTVPVGLHLMGVAGVVAHVRSRPRAPELTLCLGAVVLWLGVFSTRVPVYDGERLFLPAFALWSIVIGVGFAGLWRLAAGHCVARVALVGLFVAQAWGLFEMHPFWLSYYNGFVGGLRGAERLGLEVTYWGDAIEDRLLDELAARAARDAPCALAPSLAPDQGLVSTTPRMMRQGLRLRDQEFVSRSRWVAVYRRRAYFTPEVRALVARPSVFVQSRQGVWISGIWEQPRTPRVGVEESN